jgi:glucose/arabinose dehydrogenase
MKPVPQDQLACSGISSALPCFPGPESIFHGSWNRARRTGYKVIRIPTRQGKATGEYIDFMTGFVTPEGQVWGRPVGVAVGNDGALLVSDDGGNCIWRVSHNGTTE